QELLHGEPLAFRLCFQQLLIYQIVERCDFQIVCLVLELLQLPADRWSQVVLVNRTLPNSRDWWLGIRTGLCHQCGRKRDDREEEENVSHGFCGSHAAVSKCK